MLIPGVVFTNGCFDVLHPGHLKLLQYAKSLGEILVVGLNGDDSVRRLKGDRRPVHTWKDRARMLREFRCVALVMHFDEDTPLKLIETLKPEILVKGGDYSGQLIVGEDFIRSLGGRVELYPFVSGHSTTRILQALHPSVQTQTDPR